MFKKAFALLLLAGVTVFAQEGKPVLTFDSDVHEFGDIEQGKSVDAIFKFKNTGTSVLEIIDVKPTCGCTTAKPEKSSYQPGETGEIPVTFNSTRFSGVITKTINVVSNDPDRPRQQLQLKGKVMTEIEIAPASVALSSLKRTETVTRDVRITTSMLDKLTISDIKSPLDFVKVQQERVDDKTIDLKITVPGPDIPKDRHVFQGQLTFKTNGEKMTDGKVSIFVRTVKPVSVSPGSVYFFSTPEGKSRETMVTLRATSGEEVKFLDITSDLEFVEAAVHDPKTGQLKVVITDKAAKGKFIGKIKVKTNIKEMPEVEIPVRGTVI